MSTRLDLDGSIQRRLHVVGERKRSAEHGEDFVADELQDGAAVRKDDLGEQVIEAVEHRSHLGRLEL